ncbi:MAG: hypothetical protein QM813_27370 [Verrucomicrobiota bacterium]
MNDSSDSINETYVDLRNHVFQLSSDWIQGEGRFERVPIAVLMEFSLPQAIVTLLAVDDGTASLYFSNGGGLIGAGTSEAVRKGCLGFH